MLVKCRCCGNKVERNEAFKIVVKDKNHYYCNAIEFEQINIEKESRLKVIDLVFEIIGETTNTSVFKELTDISKVHGYQKMLSYMESNMDYLNKAMVTCSGSKEYGRIRYLMAIIKNELGDFVETITKEDDVVEVDFVENVVYTPTKKKSFTDYLDEY